MNVFKTAGIALVTFILCLPQICSGQGLKPVWEIGAGIGLLQIPDYRGSNESRFYALPYPYFIYRGDIIEVDRQTISGRIFKSDRVLLDVSYYGSVPVDSDKNSARAGMRDLDPTFEVGPALDVTILEKRRKRPGLKLFLPLRPVFSTDFTSVSHVGWLISPRLNLEFEDILTGTDFKLGISAGPMFADGGYHDFYYSVDSTYATPTRPAYQAGAGYSGSTVTVGLGKRHKQFNFHAFISADVLAGAVMEKSPLVKTNTSIMSGISISWLFYQSAQMTIDDFQPQTEPIIGN